MHYPGAFSAFILSGFLLQTLVRLKAPSEGHQQGPGPDGSNILAEDSCTLCQIKVGIYHQSYGKNAIDCGITKASKWWSLRRPFWCFPVQ